MRLKAANVNLSNKPPETLAGIERCIKSETPFVLFENDSQFVIFMVRQRKVIQVDGNSYSVYDGFSDLQAFTERVKFFLMAYDKFQEVPNARIENNHLFLE